MEMHQVRYFLAVARTLNFTRAAEECNVAQPSLTRAIKLLEEELGGDLFRRERNLSHLTDLGARMLPLLQQCYESALTAKSLAKDVKSGKLAALGIALSRTIGMELLIVHLSELVRAMPGLELKILRGTADEIGEALKKGDIELAVAGGIGTVWDRLIAGRSSLNAPISPCREVTASRVGTAPSSLRSWRASDCSCAAIASKPKS
jgi:DNA-binding transcriptional LysR family regulator